MKLAMFDVATDYRNADRRLVAVIVVETNYSTAEIWQLLAAEDAKSLLDTERLRTYVAYCRPTGDGEFVLSDNKNAAKRPIGLVKANRKLNRTKVEAFRRNDSAYRQTWMANLAKFMENCRIYSDLNEEEQDAVDSTIAYVEEFMATVDEDIMEAERVRFHIMAQE